MERPTVRVGQVWEDRDSRGPARHVTVETCDEHFAWVRWVKLSRIRVHTLQTRYRLITDTKEQHR